MKEKLLHTPEGVRDIYNSECKRKSAVEKRIHHILELYGYQDIETPTFTRAHAKETRQDG